MLICCCGCISLGEGQGNDLAIKTYQFTFSTAAGRLVRTPDPGSCAGGRFFYGD